MTGIPLQSWEELMYIPLQSWEELMYIPLQSWEELMYSSCSNRRHERGKDDEIVSNITDHIHGNLWHMYYVTGNQVMMTAVNVWSDSFNLTTKKFWCGNLLISRNTTRDPDRNHKLWSILSTYTNMYIHILHIHVLLECCYI